MPQNSLHEGKNPNLFCVFEDTCEPPESTC